MTSKHTHDDEHGSRHDYWDSFNAWTANLDDMAPVEWSDIEPAIIDGWDDIEGLDLEGNAGTESETVAWLHSLLYSDYADPSDDDDRPGMDIPRSVLERNASLF